MIKSKLFFYDNSLELCEDNTHTNLDIECYNDSLTIFYFGLYLRLYYRNDLLSIDCLRESSFELILHKNY